MIAALTEGILRREVFHRLAEDFPVAWEIAQTAEVTLRPYAEGGTGSLHVHWRGKRVARYFAIEDLDKSLDEFSHTAITDIVESLRRQLNVEPTTEVR